MEFGCGILFTIGFLTPIAAAALLGHATVIILKVQLPRGFWNSKGGIEFPLSLAGGLLGILLIGAGGFSIDGLLHLGLMSEGWVKWIGAIAGIGGGVAIYLYSVRPAVTAPPA